MVRQRRAEYLVGLWLPSLREGERERRHLAMAAGSEFTVQLSTSMVTVWLGLHCSGRSLVSGTFRFTNNNFHAW